MYFGKVGTINLGVPVQHHLHFVSINVVGSMSPGNRHAERTQKQNTRAGPVGQSVPRCSVGT